MRNGTAKTLASRLADDIAAAILSDEFAPGSRLDEHMLADRFSVSRTPVREALRQLTSTGLVVIRPRRGASVTRVEAAELENLFVAMGEMEATCARLASMCMSPIERRRLAALHESMADLVARNDVTGFAEANLAFHGQIYTGAHNPLIGDIAASLRRRISPFRRAQFRTSGRLPRSQSEHDVVVCAILAGNAAEAHAAMIHHMTLVESAFEEFASSNAA